MVGKQVLYCHNCDRNIEFEIDSGLNGQHIITCKNCNHEHCRYVNDGKITERRWGQRNNNIYYCTGTATTATYATSGSSSASLYGLWQDKGTGSTTY